MQNYAACKELTPVLWFQIGGDMRIFLSSSYAENYDGYKAQPMRKGYLSHMRMRVVIL